MTTLHENDSRNDDLSAAFPTGTWIDTPFGGAAIESLRPGDLVTVLENGRRLCRSVRRIEDDGEARASATVQAPSAPVRIHEHAFARGVPARDLLLEAGHRVHCGDALISLHRLLNGASIRFDTDNLGGSRVRLELDRQAILLAEGLAMETGAGPAGTTLACGLPMRRPCVETPAQAVLEDSAAPIRARLARRAVLLARRVRSQPASGSVFGAAGVWLPSTAALRLDDAA